MPRQLWRSICVGQRELRARANMQHEELDGFPALPVSALPVAPSAMSWHTLLSGSSPTQKRDTAGSGMAGCNGFMPCIQALTCPPAMDMQSISPIVGSVKLATAWSLGIQSRSSRRMPGALAAHVGVQFIDVLSQSLEVLCTDTSMIGLCAHHSKQCGAPGRLKYLGTIHRQIYNLLLVSRVCQVS